jgi:hypothetical protein
VANPHEHVATAADRRRWPVRVYRLGAEPDDNLAASTTAEQRLAMMWPLAVEAFVVAGREVPSYARCDAPVAVRRLGR